MTAALNLQSRKYCIAITLSSCMYKQEYLKEIKYENIACFWLEDIDSLLYNIVINNIMLNDIKIIFCVSYFLDYHLLLSLDGLRLVRSDICSRP